MTLTDAVVAAVALLALAALVWAIAGDDGRRW